MVDAAVSVASAMVISHKEVQLFQHDHYILYFCFLVFSHAYLTISTLVIVATNINQCGICNNNKPHRGITIWIWYKHSMLLLSIVYSCTCITISTFGDCSHSKQQFLPPLVRPSLMFKQQLHLLHKEHNPLCDSLSFRWDIH